ncbi:amidohydrolase family protein [Nonomuraea thailandensis]
MRHLIWEGLELGLPLQFHAGFGDPDLDLRRADPLLLRGLIELAEPTGVPLLLLHCYPYQRHAGFLAQAYPNVFFDVGLGVNYTGRAARRWWPRAWRWCRSRSCSTPPTRGAAELHHLGSVLWRRAMARVLGGFVADGEWSVAQAVRVATMVGVENARRVYGLG